MGSWAPSHIDCLPAIRELNMHLKLSKKTNDKLYKKINSIIIIITDISVAAKQRDTIKGRICLLEKAIIWYSSMYTDFHNS